CVGLLADRHLEVQTKLLLQLQFDGTPNLGLEARRGADHLVLAYVEQREDVVARFIAFSGADVAGGDASGSYGRSGNHRARRVCHEPKYLCGHRLAGQRSEGRDYQRQTKPETALTWSHMAGDCTRCFG